MLLVVDLEARDADAAEQAAHVLDEYLETLLPLGLARFRIARDVAKPAHLMLLEDWSSAAAHDLVTKKPAFAAMQAALAPLVAGPPRTTTCEIVAAGYADDADDE